MKILGIVAVDVVRESRKFSGHPYVGRIARSAHCAVIFAIAQLSCNLWNASCGLVGLLLYCTISNLSFNNLIFIFIPSTLMLKYVLK